GQIDDGRRDVQCRRVARSLYERVIAVVRGHTAAVDGVVIDVAGRGGGGGEGRRAGGGARQGLAVDEPGHRSGQAGRGDPIELTGGGGGIRQRRRRHGHSTGPAGQRVIAGQAAGPIAQG